MTATFPRQATTLRQALERAAGMHTAPVAGTMIGIFGTCVSKAHERCDGQRVVGVMTYICDCPCHTGIDPADFDAAYGPPWGVEVNEGE